MPTLTATLARCILVLLVASLVPARADERGGEWHALLVGCTEYPKLKEILGEETYKARNIELLGPSNDIPEMRRALSDLFQAQPERVRVLLGWTGVPPEQRPTYDNIVAELDRLAKAVRQGDRVLVHMAGHGSQAPDASGDELDGLDEVFLPADAEAFDLKTGKVPHVLPDDEIGAKVRAIRDKGAMVWLLMDCCHSGTMVRGADESGIVMRQIDPTLLGVPTAVSRGAPQDADEALPAAEIDEKGLAGIVAMYASQSYRTAPEMPLPRSVAPEQAKRYGLMTFMVLSQLRRAGGNVTFAELHAQVLAAYQALPYHGTVPLAEGDLQRRVFGEGSHAGPVMLLQSEGDKIVLNAGQFAGIVPKTVLAVYEPLKLDDPAALLGGVEVVSAEPLRAVCRPIELDKRTFKKLEASWRCPVQVRSRPTGDLRLKVAAMDAEGRALPRERVPKEVLDVFAANEADFALAAPAEARWSLVVDGASLWLEPTQGEKGSPRFDAKKDLLASLRQIFRAENLKHIAGTAGALPNGLRVRMVRIEGDAESELRSGAVVRPGDRIKFAIKNGTGKIQDVALLYVDAHYGVTALWPTGGQSPRLTAADTGEHVIGPFAVTDKPLGTERLLVAAMPCRDEDPVNDLSFLEQPPLDVLTRGPESSEVAALLRTLSFGGKDGQLARGLESAPEKLAMSMLVWRTEWGGLGGPGAGEGATLALRGGSVVDLVTANGTDPWRPASDPTVRRGDLSALYGRAAPAIVVVRSRVAHGTGFLIDKDHVLTNHHVVDAGFEYTRAGRPLVAVHRGAVGSDGIMALHGEPLPAEVICWDPERDLALLRVLSDAASLAGMQPIALSDAAPKPGQSCVMIGHPASGLLWTLREGNVAGVGEMPKDIVDQLVMRLAASEEQRAALDRQFAAMRQVRILMSSCQGNPGDSGGPLVDEKGRLLAVTFSIPGDIAKDKFVYHIHLDEVRAFLAGRPKPGQPVPPEVPDPWATGCRVALRQTGAGMEGRGGFDVLVAEEPHPGNPQQVISRQIFMDLDDDAAADGSAEAAVQLLQSRSFDAEVAVHFLLDRVVAFYDTDNEGGFDVVLVDMNNDGVADVGFEADGGVWKFEPDVAMAMLSTDYLQFMDGAMRAKAMMKLRVLTKR